MQNLQTPIFNARIAPTRLPWNRSDAGKFSIVVPSLLILLLFAGCKGTPCSEIPPNFSTYADAITAIESSSFQISESVNTSKSSFINDADFYSCNGQDGYLILQFKDQDYIFQGVPVEVWEGFKDAASFGTYYDDHIRGRYQYHSN